MLCVLCDKLAALLAIDGGTLALLNQHLSAKHTACLGSLLNHHVTVPCVPAAFVTALRNRRVHAAIKYWCVLVLMMVGTLLLQYFVPVSTRFSPTFGYTAAVVGMSDRVESTVFKV